MHACMHARFELSWSSLRAQLVFFGMCGVGVGVIWHPTPRARRADTSVSRGGMVTGMRDRTQLDKKDSRHISSHDYVKKTTSKKKSRVGEAGKQAREKKKLAKAKPSV
jgi:hypothetical protein